MSPWLGMSQAQQQRGRGSRTRWQSLLIALGAGSLLSYLLDPRLGRRRRARARDRARHAANMTARHAVQLEHDLINRAHGLAARLRTLGQPDDASDEVLRERVRSAMGRACSRVGAIEVAVTSGNVILSGPILEREHMPLLRTIARVRGVRSIEDKLDRHVSPDGAYGLRHDAPPQQQSTHGLRCADFMKREVQTVAPHDSAQRASEKMTLADVGFLPVCDSDRRVVGTITDRDIVVRVVAKGLPPDDTPVADAMSADVAVCRPDDDLTAAARLMGQRQVSRIVIADDNGILMGVISLSDLAERASARRAADTLRAVAAREAPRHTNGV
jgi:CBS domain-containing protein